MPIFDAVLATVQAEFSDLPDAEQCKHAVPIVPIVPKVMRRPGRRIRPHGDDTHRAQEAA